MSKIKSRAKSILKSQICNYSIRLRIANIAVQSLQLGTIGTAIYEGRIKVKLDSGNWWDPDTNTIGYDDDDIDAPSLVHEATHAAISAYNVGKNVMLGVNESAAYIAETMYWLLATGNVPDLSTMPHLATYVAPVARAAVAHVTKKSTPYTVSDADYAPIISTLNSARFAPDQHQMMRMKGIPGL